MPPQRHTSADLRRCLLGAGLISTGVMTFCLRLQNALDAPLERGTVLPWLAAAALVLAAGPVLALVLVGKKQLHDRFNP